MKCCDNMKLNFIHIGIFFVGLILFVICAIVYSSTFGCMNNTHGSIVIDKITPYTQEGIVFVDVTYHTSYLIGGYGSTCAYPSSVREEFYIDGLKITSSYHLDCNSLPVEFSGQFCQAKLLLRSNSSPSVSGRHSLKLCSNFDFNNHFFRSANSSDENSYQGMLFNSYSERYCSNEATFNFYS